MTVQPPSIPRREPESDVLDGALARLASTSPDHAGGLSNHGPMVCEALLRLGRPDAVAPWLDAYMPSLEAAPGKGSPIALDEWAGALGQRRRYPDWVARFERELAAGPWADVVGGWAPRLVAGSMATAAHGLIRTAHATRAIEEAETPERRHELAAGLAYWASTCRPFGATPAPRGTGSASQALLGVPTLPLEERDEGLIFRGAAKASRLEGFTAAVDALRPPESVDRALSDLTRAMATWYLANRGHDPIAFAHGVTAPAALRLLLPFLPAGAASSAFAYVWQACMAIRSAFAVGCPLEGSVRELPSGEELVAAAVEIGGAHAIKLTEACLREQAIRPDAADLLAAADAGRRLEV